LDHDTPDIFDRTLQAIYDWGLDESSFSIITPYPGTRLFDRLKKEGRITNYDWSNYTEGKVNIKPKMMTAKELLEGIMHIAGDFYSIKSSLNRSFNLHTNPLKSPIIFAGNMTLQSFYKKEKLSI